MKDLRSKIVSRADLPKIVKALRKDNKKIVFTNGCFDILHLGHIRYLQQAKSLGDMLIVGLNNDASVRKLKGEERPIVPEDERLEVIAALECVDYVTLFPELTPENLIRIIKPDIHVKGGDYRPEDLPEAAAVRESGGEVQVLSFLPGRSTTKLIEEITKRYG